METGGTEPLVSIVVAAFDAGATLGAALASILAQTHHRLEVIVVDDGSTDDTAAVAQRATDPRVRVLSHDRNLGRSSARNTGLDATTGEWVAIVDADDLIAADRIEHLLAAASRFPGTNLVTDDRIGWFRDGDGAIRVTHRIPGRATWRVGAPHRLDPVRHFTDSYGHADFLVQRAFLDHVGVRYPPDMDVGEDLVVANGLLFHPDCRPVRDARAGYYYRWGPTKRTQRGAEAHAQMVALIDDPTLTRLYRRWQPAHSWLLDRVDRDLAAQGRLVPRSTTSPAVATTPRASRGAPMLVALKALQYLTSASERSTRRALRDDIDRQARRTI